MDAKAFHALKHFEVSPRDRSIFHNTEMWLLFFLLCLAVLFLAVLSWVRIVTLMYSAEGLTESRMELRSDKMINLTIYD